MEERIYTPESEMKRPLALFANMWRDLWRARYLAWRILVRDVSSRYRQTLLGYLWIFIPPVFVALGLTLATRAQVLRIASTDIPYPAYVVFCMALWQTFADAVNGPLSVTQQSRSVLARLNFPREALLLARLGDVLGTFGVRLMLIAAVFLLFRVPVPASGLLAIPATLPLILFGFGLGLLLSPFATLYHDLLKGVSIVLTAWMFVTPVLYPLPPGEGLLQTIVRWNPVTPLLMTPRELATGMPLTLPVGFAVVGFLAAAILAVAWLVYKVSLPYVIERLRA